MSPDGARRYFAGHALLPGGPARDVLLELAGGRFTAVRPDSAPDGAVRLPGMVLPGFADAHSHAFHRALRGRTSADGGSFWTWRRAMYAVAGRLDPDRYLQLARAAYAELALAGVTAVGEFHYLHHAPDGVPYRDPNAMAEALREAAAQAGIRLTVLDACYLAGGLGPAGHEPLAGVQRRFGDATAERWAQRVAALRPSAGMRVGAAVHSVRAVPRAALGTVVAAAAGRPLHAHLSEQPAENEACLAHYGRTPTALLAEAGALGPASTVVHATHLSEADVAALGSSATTVCFCPTTERDLADGIGPAGRLLAAGARPALGSDQHVLADLLAEAQALEAHERLATLRRGRFRCPGWPRRSPRTPRSAGRTPDGSRPAPGPTWSRCGWTPSRTAGCDPDQVLLGAAAADVDTVLADGEVVVSGGAHRLGDVGELLARGDRPAVGGMRSVLVTGIAELVTHDRRAGHPRRRRARRRPTG